MLPKDYVRLRLTGEWATDVADASGTLLLDVARRRWCNEMLDALDLPGAWLPRLHGVPVAARRLRRRSTGVASAGRLPVGRPGDVGVVFAALPRPSPSRRRASTCTPCPIMARDGRVSAAGSLQCSASTRSSTRPAGGRPALTGCSSCRTSGERTPYADPDARGAFVGLELRTTEVRSRAPCSKASPSAFATRSSSCAARRRAGSARLGRRGAFLASHRRVRARPSRRDDRSKELAFGAALLGGAAAGVFADVDDAVARCVRTGAEPDPAWVEYAEAYPALCTREAAPQGGAMTSLEGKVAVVTGASRGIGAAVARALADEGVKLGSCPVR